MEDKLGVILKGLESLGKALASNANPNTYSHEYRERAEHFKLQLAAARQVYRALKSGSNREASLRALLLAIPTGIAHNQAKSLYDFEVTGEMTPWLVSVVGTGNVIPF